MAMRLSHSFTLSSSDLGSSAQHYCPAHTTEEIRMFCKDCDDLVCTKCIIASHNGHHFDDNSVVVMEKKDELVEILSELQDRWIPDAEEKLKRLHELRENNEKQSEYTIKLIKQKRDELQKKLDEITNTRVIDVKKIERKNSERVTKSEAKIMQIMSDINSYIVTCKEAKDAGDNIHIINTSKALKNTEIPPAGDLPSVFPPQFTSGELSTEMIETTFGKVPDDFEVEVSSDSVHFETKLLTKFKHFSSGIVSISPDVENMALVRCHKSSNINLIDSRGGVQQTINVGTKVDDVVFLTDGSFLLSCPDIKEIIECTKEGRINGTVLKTRPLIPGGICKTYSNSFIVCLCDCFSLKLTRDSRRVVEEYNFKGQRIGKIDFHDNRPLFTFPSGVSAARNGNIAVLDLIGKSRGRILMFDPSYNLSFTFRGVTSGEGNRIQRKFWPGCICFDPYCNLLITDMVTKSVFLLDESGNIMKLFQTSNNTFPRTIGISENGRIWIGNFDGEIEILEYKR